jgi:hypothetical protein
VYFQRRKKRQNLKKKRRIDKRDGRRSLGRERGERRIWSAPPLLSMELHSRPLRKGGAPTGPTGKCSRPSSADDRTTPLVVAMLAPLRKASTDDDKAAAVTELAAAVEEIEDAEDLAALSVAAHESGVLRLICEMIPAVFGAEAALAILTVLTTVDVNPRASEVKAVCKACDAVSAIVPHLFSTYVRSVALACAVCANISTDPGVAETLQQSGGVGRLRQLAVCEHQVIASAANGCLGNLTASQATAAVAAVERERDAAFASAEELKSRLSGMATMAALSKASMAAEKAAELEVARAEATVAQAAALQAARDEAASAVQAASELAATLEKAKSDAAQAVTAAVAAAHEDVAAAQAAAVTAARAELEAERRTELEEALKRATEAQAVAVEAAVAAAREEAQVEHARQLAASAVVAKEESDAALSAALAKAREEVQTETQRAVEAARAELEVALRSAMETREVTLRAEVARQTQIADARLRELRSLREEIQGLRDEVERGRALAAELRVAKDEHAQQQAQQLMQQQAQHALSQRPLQGLSQPIALRRPRSADVTPSSSRRAINGRGMATPGTIVEDSLEFSSDGPTALRGGGQRQVTRSSLRHLHEALRHSHQIGVTPPTPSSSEAVATTASPDWSPGLGCAPAGSAVAPPRSASSAALTVSDEIARLRSPSRSPLRSPLASSSSAAALPKLVRRRPRSLPSP